jgi:hypothetical protein
MGAIKQGDGLWGDALLYYGLMSAVDSTYGVRIQACQDVSGRIWRNEYYADRQIDYMNSCSRDMLSGFLLGCTPLQAQILYRYLKHHNWLLCPKASDNRNKAGLMGRLEVWAKAYDKKWVYHIVAFISLFEALGAWKGYQLHLVMIALLRCKQAGVMNWFYRQTLKICDTRSKGNAVVAFLKRDVWALGMIELKLESHKADGQEFSDVWPFASFEVWRELREAHPLALEFVGKAREKLSERTR